jgi:hypothetical protein
VVRKRRLVSAAAVAGRGFGLSTDMEIYLHKVGCRVPSTVVPRDAQVKGQKHQVRVEGAREVACL